jgi:O-acetyl-ADP-ribose deacetylase (regulator of RNase III)
MKDYNSNGGADESSAGDESSADDDSGSQNSPCSISLYRTFEKEAGDAMEAFLNVAICYLPPETEDERVFEKDQFDVMKESLASELSLYNETVVDFNSIRNTFDQVALTKESRLKALLFPLDGVWFVKLRLNNKVIVGGAEDGVREARGFLETLPQEDQIVVESVEVDDPKHASLLVSAPYTQALQALMDLATLPSEAKRLDKKKGKSATTIFTLEGKRSAIQSIKDNVKTQADIWARELEREPLNDFLDPLELSYLKDEGSSTLKHTAKKFGVVVTSPASPIVPSLSHADPSINRKLMSGEIAGKRCSVFVSVEVGNLLKAVCQSIANPASRSLDNNGGVAKAISVAGGVKFDEDCKSYIKQYGEIGMGAAVAVGRVKDTAVVHAVGPTFSDSSIEHSSRLYEKTIRSALSAASNGGYESIALPLFGSGIYGWNAETAANLTIRAISSWASEAPTTIQIVLVMTDATKDAMVNAIRNFSRLPLPSDVNADATPALSPPKFSCFWQNDFRGWTPYDYDQSMKIERAIDKNEFPVTLRGDKGGQQSDSKHIPAGEDSALYTVERKSIVSFDGEKCSYVQKNIVSKFERPVKIRPFDPSNPMPLFSSYQTPMASSEVIRYSALTLHSTPTKVTSGGGSKVASGGGSSSASPPAPPLKRTHSLGGSLDDKLIEGSSECIKDFKSAIGAIVEEKKREEDIDLSSLKEYGNDLMSLFEDGSASIVVISGQKHHFKLTAYGRAFDDANRRVLKFKTKILEDLSRTVWPEHWPKQIEYDLSQPQCEFVEVPSGSQEYSFVEEEFRGRTKGPRGVFHKDVVKIERVQNPVLWDAYYNHCKHLASKAGSNVDSSSSLFKKANEHWTKHGTSKTDPKVVAGSEAGVDARHCTSGLFGTGAYTAEDAEYSHSYNFCYTCPNGDMQMLLVRVAAGKISEEGGSTNATRALIKPPPGHDSVRGVVAANFKALIVYTYQAIYPAYLITYKK